MKEELEALKAEVENYRGMILELYMLKTEKEKIDNKIEFIMKSLTNLLLPSEFLNGRKEKCCNKKGGCC